MPRFARPGIVAALAATIPVMFFGLFFAWPVVATLWRAVTDAGLAGQTTMVSTRAVIAAAGTTLGLAATGTALTLAVGLPAVWALHRAEWRGARIVSAALTAPFVMPTVVVALAFLTVQRDVAPWLGRWDGLPAIVAALAFFNVAVVLRTVGPSLEGLDERQVAAARSLGASPTAAASYIVWPAIRRSVGAAAAITFLFCATSFALVLVLGGTRVQTLETAAYLELTTFLDLRGAALIALVQAALIIGVATAVSRLTRRGPQSPYQGAPLRSSASWKDTPRLALLLTPAATLALVPMATLATRSLRGSHGELSFDGYRALFAGGGLASALASSLAIAVAATGVSMVVAVLAVFAAETSTHARWVRAFTMGPLAVSSVVVGVGLLLALAAPARDAGPWGSWWLLVAAQTLVAVPLVVRTVSPAVELLDPRQAAVAATLGASPARATWHVVLPRLRPALLSGAGLAFAVAVGEFGASVFLTKAGEPTLPVAIVRLLSRPGAENFAAACAGAIVLAVVTAAAMMLAQPRQRETAR